MALAFRPVAVYAGCHEGSHQLVRTWARTSRARLSSDLRRPLGCPDASLHATADEVIAVVVVCIAVIGAQAAIHLIAAYVRMSLLLNRVAPGSGGQVEIRADELLAEMEKNKGAQGIGSNQHQVRSRRATTPQPPKLSDLGITKSQSSRWQQLVVAALSDNTGRKLTDEE